MMSISFIVANIFAGSIGTINSTLLGKSIASATLSRGVLLGAAAVCGSIGVLLIDGVGGHVYDLDKRNPFWMVISSEGLVIILTIGLALAK